MLTTGTIHRWISPHKQDLQTAALMLVMATKHDVMQVAGLQLRKSTEVPDFTFYALWYTDERKMCGCSERRAPGSLRRFVVVASQHHCSMPSIAQTSALHSCSQLTFPAITPESASVGFNR